MQDYKVSWTIIISAASAIDAAKEALYIMRDSESAAVVFEVTHEGFLNL